MISSCAGGAPGGVWRQWPQKWLSGWVEYWWGGGGSPSGEKAFKWGELEEIGLGHTAVSCKFHPDKALRTKEVRNNCLLLLLLLSLLTELERDAETWAFFLSTNARADTFGPEDCHIVSVLVCWAEELFLLNLIDLRELRKIFNVEITWTFSCIWGKR